MTSKPVELRVPITELLMLVDQKSKQTDINNRPKPMSSPTNGQTSLSGIRHGFMPPQFKTYSFFSRKVVCYLLLAIGPKSKYLSILIHLYYPLFAAPNNIAQYGNTGCGVFKRGGTKLERFLHKNQCTQKKVLNFEFWIRAVKNRASF